MEPNSGNCETLADGAAFRRRGRFRLVDQLWPGCSLDSKGVCCNGLGRYGIWVCAQVDPLFDPFLWHRLQQRHLLHQSDLSKHAAYFGPAVSLAPCTQTRATMLGHAHLEQVPPRSSVRVRAPRSLSPILRTTNNTSKGNFTSTVTQTSTTTTTLPPPPVRLVQLSGRLLPDTHARERRKPPRKPAAETSPRSSRLDVGGFTDVLFFWKEGRGWTSGVQKPVGGGVFSTLVGSHWFQRRIVAEAMASIENMVSELHRVVGS